ncbi:MAG TPA: DinB family protein [Gemmatimonadales bacterium]
MTVFRLDEAIAVLERTPDTLRTLLDDLPEPWTTCDEGPETWSPVDVVGHLIHGERADWIVRARTILDGGERQPFDPFDRLAQFEASKGQSIRVLLDEFAQLRAENIATLEGLALGERDLDKTGTHPALGRVTMRQLLATWVAHDLGHIAQIGRVMAKRYGAAAGPWVAYLPILGDRPRRDA